MTARLGDRVRDRITEYEGIVIAETLWLNGCRRLTLQAPGEHEGKRREPLTIDETDAVVIESVFKLFKPSEPFERTGGPRPDPVQRTDPV